MANDETSQLPPFAKQWVNQWKAAAPRLQAIRDEELRRQGHTPPPTKSHDETPIIYDRYPERHGMVIMQRWLTRMHLLQLIQDQKNAE